MKKIALMIAFSFLAVFALSIGTPSNSVQASEVEYDNLAQNDSIFVTTTLQFSSYPPLNYYWNDGKYKGYIIRVDIKNIGGTYFAVYAGTVYQNAPIYSKSVPVSE